MKKQIKLVKEKNFFQVLWDKKSVTEFDDDWVKGIEIQGYASTKDKDRGHDIVEPEAFKKALDLYMTNPVVLLQHNMDKPIWVVTEATIDNNGLFIKARITQDIDWVISAIKNGVLRAFSIWFRIKENSFEEYENNNWDRDYTNTIKDLELFEISVVSVPMNAYALMKSMQDCFEIKEVEATEETEKAEDVDVPLDTAAEVPNEEAETQETSEEENSSKSEETETEEKSEEVESEEVEEEKKEIEWEETAVETVAESETEATETAETENTQEEETESDSESEETETKSVESETVEETETQADENSEIEETQEESDHSENDSETESNDWEVVEKAANNLKDLQTKSIEKFISAEMKSVEKKFDDIIAEKDAKIKELEQKLEKAVDLLGDTVTVLWQIDKAVSNTVVKTWYTYQAPQVKKTSSRYWKLVAKLQSI